MEQKAELRALVIQGPDPAVHKVVRWRCADLRDEVARRWQVEVHENTISEWLGGLGLTRLQPRPVHSTAATAVEIWFQDEARVGQKGGCKSAPKWAPSKTPAQLINSYRRIDV